MSRWHPDTNNRKREKRELLFIDKDDFHVVREMLVVNRRFQSGNPVKLTTDEVYKAVDVREGDEERRVHCLDFTHLRGLYLPNEIGNLSNLNKLLLSFCDIRWIPPSIGRLQNLEELDLSNNEKLSELPDEIGDLASLIKLKLGWNRSIKFLPRSIERLRNLKELNLSRLDELKELPEEIGNLTSLIKLDLSHVRLVTSLPPSIGRLRNLEYLDISFMRRLTRLPEEIGELSQLNMLHMASLHKLTSLPFSFGRLRNLTVLDLSLHTWFELPEVVGELVGLTKLRFGTYEMTSLPTWIGRLQNLEDIDLSETSSLSTLPREIEDISRLKKLNLESSFIKSLPFIGRLGNLRELNLKCTILLKKLPEEIGQLTNLEELDLSCSGITSLPISIGRLTSLRFLSLVQTPIPELRGDDAEAFVLKLAQRCPQLQAFEHNAELKNKIPDFAFACKRARSRISLFEKYCDDSVLTMRKLLPHMIHNARRAFDRDVIKLKTYFHENPDRKVPWIRNCDAIYWLLSQKANYLHPAS